MLRLQTVCRIFYIYMPIYARDLLRERLGAFAVDSQPKDLAGGRWEAELLKILVGERGFEPPTPWSPNQIPTPIELC